MPASESPCQLLGRARRFTILPLFYVIMTASSLAQFKTIVTLTKADGAQPNAPLVQGFDGNLYGTAATGGSENLGTIFNVTNINSTPAVTVIHNFCSKANCADGELTRIGLTLANDGNYYGVTTGGGIPNSSCFNDGCGTFFRVTPLGVLITLHDFCKLPGCTDGAVPYFTRLAQGTDGNLYGITLQGGSGLVPNSGTIFKVTRSGTLTILYSFCSQTDCTDGDSPNSIIVGTDGNFYGTTGGGGANNAGTVYKLTPAGALTTIYSFCSLANCADGKDPEGGLVQAADGNFYGTTFLGGVSGPCNYPTCGVIYKVTPQGELTTLYDFCSQAKCADGAFSESPLIQATDGNFYGVTDIGGSAGFGTLFKLTPTGTLTTLRNFITNDPGGALLQHTNGNLYSTSGAIGGSTVYEWITHLKPFVATVPTVGKRGSKVIILGSGLTGTTAVKFNGISATFAVISDTEITTKVPAGLSAGIVSVTTPTGTLSSNIAFSIP